MAEQTHPSSPHPWISILSELSAILQGEGNFAQKQNALFARLRVQPGCDLVWLGLLEGQPQHIQGQGGFTPKGSHGLLTSRMALVPGEFIDRVTTDQEVFLSADLGLDPRSKAWWVYAREWGIQGVAAFPLIWRGSCLGICVLGSCRWGLLLSTAEARSIKILGDLIGAALSQDKTEVELARQNQLTAPLLALTDRLRQPQQMDPVFQSVVDELFERLTPSRTAIYWLDADRREYWVRSTRQKPNGGGPVAATRIPLLDLYGLYQEFKEDRAVAITDIHADLRALIGQPYLQKFKLLALLAHPIIYQGELLGHLSIEHDQPRVWQLEEHQLVRAMANLIGVTTTQARLYEITRRQALEQTLINQITRDIRNTLDPDQVLHAAVERLGSSLDVDRCLVMNFSPGELDVLHEYRKPGVPAAPSKMCSPTHKLEQRTLTSSVPVAIDDIETDFRFLSWRDSLHASSTRALVICGTAYQGRPNGILVLQHCYKPHSWTQEEKSIVQAVADQVGIALGQARLYRQTQETAEIERRINQVGMVVRQAVPTGDVAKLILQELSEAMEAPAAALVLCTSTEESMPLKFVYSLSNRLQLPPQTLLQVADPFIQAVFDSPEPVESVLSLDTPTDPQPALRERGVRALLGMRLQAGQQTLGLVLVMDTHPRRWGRAFSQILTRSVGEVALAFSQAQSFEKLQELSQQLHQLNEYKSNLVGIASHEMRTPLASIRAYIETMLTEPDLDAETIQEFMGGMELECIRLTNLLDDLTTLVTLEAHRTEWHYCDLTVQELLGRVIEKVRPLGTLHQVEIRVENALPVNTILYTDGQKVEQVLYNLLANACKHTRPGCQAILSTYAHSPDWIEFSVCDDGPGIPADKLSSLFQPFVRVQDVMNHSKGGAGLGLAICKGIIDQMGGKIEVHSQLGQGSRFRVTLPVQPVSS